MAQLENVKNSPEFVWFYVMRCRGMLKRKGNRGRKQRIDAEVYTLLNHVV